MTLRLRLLWYSGILLFSLTVITSLTLFSAVRYQRIQASLSLGQELQIRSRDVMGLMKDLVFELFSPQLYGHVRSLTYAPRSSVTLRQWTAAVDEYMKTFEEFMASPMHFSGTGDELMDQYETADRMNTTALAKLARMESILFAVQAIETEEENLYSRMQSDATLIPFFNEVQETSYYFTNSFESFMNYFIGSYRDYGRRLQKRTIIIDIIVAALVVAGAMTAMYLISKDLLTKIQSLEGAFTRVSRGDFSHPLNPAYDDELGELGRRFDELSHDLKENVESILELTRNVGAALEEEIPEETLQELIVQALVRDTAADGAGYYSIESGGALRLAAFATSTSSSDQSDKEQFPMELADPEALIASAAAKGKDAVVIADTRSHSRRYAAIPLAESGISSLVALPIIPAGRCDAVLIAVITDEDRFFTDLGITRMVTFGEFSSLTIDHHRRYAELLEKGKAEYQALQSQVQPHFIYNVLSALFALNRKGDRETLESSILSFRKMLRYVQDGGRETTIEEEFAFLKEYLELQKLRFGDRLDYELTVQEGTGNIMIPRLLLQPLVENAVIHGLEPLDHAGRLTAETSWTYRDGAKLLEIEIRDNGAGLPKEVLEGGGRIGLPNVKARLQLTYPGARFNVTSQDNSGTRIRLEIDIPMFAEAEI
ncbi:MAG: histidine kinase [Spirochaetaceae bacterium]|nr:histidine kinase [Spirochaetaceae bacterium]